MTPVRPCYRHSRKVWMAACEDCTTWHIAVRTAGRSRPAAELATARQVARPTSRPVAAPVGWPALRGAA
jgi:hypothetical protein